MTPFAVSPDRTTVTLTPIRPGRAGTLDRLDVMSVIVKESLLDLIVPETARAIVTTAVCDGHDPASLASALVRWMSERVQFIPDYLGWADVFHTPRYVLEVIQSQGVAGVDCDDAAILAAALGLSVGLRSRFVAVAFQGDASRAFRHVWTEYDVGWDFGNIINCDITRPPGEMPPVADVLYREV